MKRLLLSAAIAFGLHGLVFAIDPQWMTYKPPEWQLPVPVSITLSYIERKAPAKPDIEPAENPPTPQPAIQAPKPKPVPKPPPPAVKKTSPEENPKEQPPAPDTTKAEPSPEPETDDSQIATEVFEPIRERTEAVSPTEMSALTPTPSSVSTPEPELVEARPLFQQNPAPKYPRVARKRGYQGTVILEVLVDRTGDVEDVKVHQSSGFRVLDKAALASVKHWVFMPGRRGDDTVAMWVRVPIAFRLTE